MKLVEVGVSNIRSFGYQDQPTPIEFDSKGLSLIIGSNGSGKSNLIEIVTRLFTHIYGSELASYNEELQRLIQNTADRQQIGEVLSRPSTFTKHHDSPNKPSKIKFKILLESSDIETLKRIQANREMLNRIYAKYFKDETGIVRLFQNEESIPAKPTEYEIELEDTIENGNEKIFQETDTSSLAVKYLRDYKIISTLISMHNDLLLKEIFMEIQRTQPGSSYQNTIDMLQIDEQTKPIEPLRSLVLLMSVQDRINEISLDYVNVPADNVGIKTSVTGRRRNFVRQLSSKSTMGSLSAAQSEAFEIFKASLYEECVKLVSGRRTKEQVTEAVNKTNKQILLMNNLLATFDLRIQVKDFDPARTRLTMSLKHAVKDVSVFDLSSGQRALLSIASNLVLGSELQSLVLIDEVENHLHPITQAQLRDVLASLSTKQIQAICITHSPIFVSPATIRNTLRVTISDGKTKVQDCSKALTKNAKALINVLQYSNGARIFFTDKVLLSEGISDEEFYTAYIRKFYPKSDIEVLSTNTKGQIKNWRSIIEEFGIKVCSISDLDDAKKGEVKRKPNHPKKEGYSLVKADVDDNEYKILLSNITSKKKDQTYILSEGALESYVPGSSKDKVQRVRDFLENPIWSKLRHRQEIKSILQGVVDF